MRVSNAGFSFLFLAVLLFPATTASFVGGFCRSSQARRGKSCSRYYSTRQDSDAPLDNIRSVRLSKPMGLVLEELEEGKNCGVFVARMGGAAAAASQRNEIDLCVGDVLVSVNGMDCQDMYFDHVMDALIKSDNDDVLLRFRRQDKAVAVRFLETGAAVAALPGTPLKKLARIAQVQNIQFSCNSGDCATCEQRLINDKDCRYVRVCVAKVPKGSDRITVASSDRWEF